MVWCVRGELEHIGLGDAMGAHKRASVTLGAVLHNVRTCPRASVGVRRELEVSSPAHPCPASRVQTVGFAVHGVASSHGRSGGCCARRGSRCGCRRNSGGRRRRRRCGVHHPGCGGSRSSPVAGSGCCCGYWRSRCGLGRVTAKVCMLAAPRLLDRAPIHAGHGQTGVAVKEPCVHLLRGRHLLLPVLAHDGRATCASVGAAPGLFALRPACLPVTGASTAVKSERDR
mmetsp:Transcript_47055/g.108744  ORF Transcript_47055/g.108744 Transcript_47055/m.108744 type:complete len:228 (+) Transcript_47055:286-969(+)